MNARFSMTPLPGHVQAYSRTKEFSADSVPDALTTEHKTKVGTWAVITVLAGQVDYFIEGRDTAIPLTPETPGIIEPTVPHRVAPSPDASFFVEFYR